MFHEDAAGGWQLVAVDVNKPQGRAPACLQVQYDAIFKTHAGESLTFTQGNPQLSEPCGRPELWCWRQGQSSQNLPFPPPLRYGAKIWSISSK